MTVCGIYFLWQLTCSLIAFLKISVYLEWQAAEDINNGAHFAQLTKAWSCYPQSAYAVSDTDDNM